MLGTGRWQVNVKRDAGEAGRTCSAREVQLQEVWDRRDSRLIDSCTTVHVFCQSLGEFSANRKLDLRIRYAAKCLTGEPALALTGSSSE